MADHDYDLEPRETNRFPMLDNMPPSTALFESSYGERLRSAISVLYDAFESCRLDGDFSCCPHCFTDDDIQYLRNTPLREFSDHDIAFILGKSIYTLGAPKDFNYFLPRVLEAWANHVHYMDHVLPEKLEMARKAGWTQEQQFAVAEFVRLFFLATNDVCPNTIWFYGLSGETEDRLGRQFPDIAHDLHIELHE